MVPAAPTATNAPAPRVARAYRSATVPLVLVVHVVLSALNTTVPAAPTLTKPRLPVSTALRSAGADGFVFAVGVAPLSPAKIDPPAPTITLVVETALTPFNFPVPSGAPTAQLEPANLGVTTCVGAPGPPGPPCFLPFIVNE